MNSITIMGNLGHDPSHKTLDSGMTIVEMSVATTHKKKQGEEWVDETTWHRVKAFGNRADAIKKFFSKGDKILVVGRQENRKYEDKDGNTRWASEVILQDFHFVGGSKRAEDSGEARIAQDQTPSAPRVNSAPTMEELNFNKNENLPF